VSSAADVLALARKELGYNEGPNNDTKYAKQAGHANHQPWCATFVVAMFRAAGMKLPSESAYTPAMANGFRNTGAWTNRPAVGAVVFFQWPSMGRIAHVGIVESVRPDGAVITIEGNTNPKGSRTGGAVMRHVRRANIAGYGIPRYSGGSKPVDTTPKKSTTGGGGQQHGQAAPYPGVTREGMRDSPITRAYQERLKGRGWRIAVDGDHGPGTTRVLKAFQAEFHLKVDGVGGRDTWNCICTKPVTR